MLLTVSQAASQAVERALFTEITESKSLSVHCLPALHCTALRCQPALSTQLGAPDRRQSLRHLPARTAPPASVSSGCVTLTVTPTPRYMDFPHTSQLIPPQRVPLWPCCEVELR